MSCWRVGNIKFITMLDLTKGCWQLALAHETKELTVNAHRALRTLYNDLWIKC